MATKIIKYFKDGLKKKLTRPCCKRFLSLWDDREWKNHVDNIKLDYIKYNDFLLFLYQTQYDLCCVEDNNAQNLRNAIDKFFYLLFEFERHYSIFISNKIYKCRLEIINDVIHYYQYNLFPQKILFQYRYIELFKDLIKRIDEWKYWKRLIIINYAKIILTNYNYEYAQNVASKYLHELVENIEKLFNKGLDN